MKNDINLLQKRKNQKFSGQKWAALILVIVLIAGAAYAGITIPSSLRFTAHLAAAKLNSDIQNATGQAGDLSELNSAYAQRKEQLDALATIDTSTSAISEYINAVEQACPTTVNLSLFNASGETIHINGTAASDEDIATFCLHLRETGIFSSVFLENSVDTVVNGADNAGSGDILIITEDAVIVTSFTITLTLPVTLDSSAVLPEPTEEPSEEVSQ